MSVATIGLALAAVLLVGALLRPLSAKLGIPFPALLLLSGFTFSEVVTSLGFDLGIRWHHFRDIVFYGFIPALVFNTAIRYNWSQDAGDLLTLSLLAMPIAVFSGVIVAVSVFMGINHPIGFPLVVALLLGAILSATDPESIIETWQLDLRNKKLVTLLRGESLLNDAIAIVLFSLLVNLALMNEEIPPGWTVATRLIWVLVAGGMMGFLTAIVLRATLKNVENSDSTVLIFLATAYLLYGIADIYLAVSGVAAVLVLGLAGKKLILSNAGNDDIYRVLTEMLTIFLYFLGGVTITLSMFQDRWLAMIIAIVAAVIARSIGACLYVAAKRVLYGGEHRIRSFETWAVACAGSPGAVALALALSLPLEVPGWYTVQAAVYAVVVFGLFVQIPLCARIHKGVNRRP